MTQPLFIHSLSFLILQYSTLYDAEVRIILIQSLITSVIQTSLLSSLVLLFNIEITFYAEITYIIFQPTFSDISPFYFGS